MTEQVARVMRITKGMTETAHGLKCHGHMIKVFSFQMIVYRLPIDVTTGITEINGG
jgi:hypothetical protein